MSEVVKINGYDIKDLKSIRSYDTVALMKADTKLKEGQHVKTKGYYSVGDGGNAEYLITDIQSLTDYQEELSNNLYATLIIKDFITPEQFGSYGDNIHNDTDTLQNAIDYALSKKILLTSNKNKVYKVTDTILINDNMTIDFNNAEINGTVESDETPIVDIYKEDIGDYEETKNYKTFSGFLKNLIINGNNTGIGIEIRRQKKLYINNIEIVNCKTGMKTTSSSESVIDTIRFQSCEIGLYCHSYDTVFQNLFGRFCKKGIYADRSTSIYNSHFWVDSSIDEQFLGSIYLETTEQIKLHNAQIDSYETGIKISGTGNSMYDISGLWQQPNDSTRQFTLFKLSEATSNKKGRGIKLHDLSMSCKLASPYASFSDIPSYEFEGNIDYNTVYGYNVQNFPLTIHTKVNITNEKFEEVYNRVNIINDNFVNVQLCLKVLENFSYENIGRIVGNYLPLQGKAFIGINGQQYSVSYSNRIVNGFYNRNNDIILSAPDSTNIQANTFIFIDFNFIRESINRITE